jgi:hypothetical protein
MMIGWRAAALAALAAVSAPALAQSGWAQVGHSVAAAGQGSTTMTPTLDPRYRELMFCVDGSVIRLNDATIHFDGGTQQTIRVRARVTNGGCSRMFTLSSRHTIQRVEVAYDPVTLGGASAQVQLYARP